jgi:hypothetical protein
MTTPVCVALFTVMMVARVDGCDDPGLRYRVVASCRVFVISVVC